MTTVRRRPGCMRVLSWNVAKRRDCGAQVDAIARLKPDVVALQEVNHRTWPRHRDELARAGLVHALSAIDIASSVVDDETRALPCFVAVASRWPLRASRSAPIPARQAIACVTVTAPDGVFDLVAVHIPTYGRPIDRALKMETQEGLVVRLKRMRRPTLLCGDFNSPLAETADGAFVPFARRRGSRACAAESALMGSTTACGLIDLFRAMHGYGVDAHSWYWKNRGRTGGFRLDHIFASREFVVRGCDYIHDWRVRGLSDHSAIFADVALSTAASATTH